MSRAVSTVVSCALAAVIGLPGVAHASGLELPAPGTTRSGAARLDAASVHYNPAMIGLLDRASLLASGGLLAGRVSYTRERLARYQFSDSFDFALPIDEADIDDSKTGSSEPVTAAPLSPIGDLFWAQPLARAPLAFGAGVYVPYGAVLNLPDDGPQRWAIQDVTLVTAAFTPAVAVRPVEVLSLGVSVPVYVGLAELSRVQDFAELADMGAALERPPISQPNDFGPDAPTGVRELDVLGRPIVLSRATGVAPTFAIGLGVRAGERVNLGASYTHRAAMTFVGDVGIDMDDDFFTQDLAGQGLAFKPLVEGRGTLSVTLPWSLRLGATAQVASAHELMVNAAVVGWSTVDSFDVRAESPDLAQAELGLPSTVSLALDRAWKNTFDVEAVHTADLSDTWALWWGLGVHSPAPPDRTMDLAAIDGWRLTAVAGGAVTVSERLTLALDAELHGMPQREVTRSRHDIGNGSYNLALFRLAGHLQVDL